MIRDKCPNQLKLPFALWTRIAVKQLIEQLWSIRMPIRTVGEYLKRWGFTPQKPLKRAYEQNPKAVKKWLDEQYPSIAGRARKEKAEIHWGDETGLLNNSYYRRSYPTKHTGGSQLDPEKAFRRCFNKRTAFQGEEYFLEFSQYLFSNVGIRRLWANLR